MRNILLYAIALLVFNSCGVKGKPLPPDDGAKISHGIVNQNKIEAEEEASAEEKEKK